MISKLFREIAHHYVLDTKKTEEEGKASVVPSRIIRDLINRRLTIILDNLRYDLTPVQTDDDEASLLVPDAGIAIVIAKAVKMLKYTEILGQLRSTLCFANNRNAYQSYTIFDVEFGLVN